MLTDRELQTMRNLGGFSEEAADEIERLQAQADALTEDAVSLRAERDNARADRDALRAQVAGLEVDAGRWLHWRKHHHYTALPVFGFSFAQIEHWSNQQNEDKLDAAIDAARGKTC